MAITHQLGPFRLDGQAGVLFRGAEPLGLGQGAVRPLRVLVERAGAPVSKHTLIDAGWAGLAVEEGNLTVQIAAVRRVLGQEPGGENWIEALPCRGYSYIGPVGETEDESSVAVPIMEATPALQDRPSIAVLPFQSPCDDPEQEYFADGVVEEIITGLVCTTEGNHHPKHNEIPVVAPRPKITQGDRRLPGRPRPNTESQISGGSPQRKPPFDWRSVPWVFRSFLRSAGLVCFVPPG